MESDLEDSLCEENTVSSHYDLSVTLGKGNFGHVKLGYHRLTATDVAVKVLKKTEIDGSLIRRETEIMKMLQHPNIIKLYQVINTVENVYFVLEYASKGELKSYVEKLGHVEEEGARRLFLELCWEILFCHQNRVAHCDLKAKNILLNI
ncbi:sperm motility kinase X-like [Nannospalax galili]|uniref:sperm motility kinase X-like n=1 Tax=Nannospalax galili TaxID=1026970 RepID=UPI00111C902C|nr:sperm motility kinase X-like [Nannospalax galili]